MRWASLVFVSFVGVLTACASAGPRPGIGDISFRLTWSGVVDLDLYVISPLDERLSFIRKSVDSGGVLDIDCNVRPFDGEQPAEESSWVCPQPMENVYWPKGDAPEGTYRYWLVLAYPDGMKPEDEFVLEVRNGRKIVRSHSGPVSDLLEGNPSFEIDFVRQ